MMLQADGLAVHFGAIKAVDGVDLVIERGEIHGVIGPNGAGKSTFIDALSGRVRPTRGRVLMAGADVTRRSSRWRRRHGMGRSFQRTSVFPTLTVRSQLDLVARHLAEPDLGQVVDALELGGLLDRVCGTIAYGDQRRVDLALALMGRPEVLLLDEPAAGLTADETQRLVEHVAELARERALTVVLVEHDVAAVFACCSRVTVLDQGQVLISDVPEVVRTDRRVITAYLGSTA